MASIRIWDALVGQARMLRIGQFANNGMANVYFSSLP
jgi:hypothetical protein